jgi:NitT/TauT family transport system permease protein
MTNAEATQAKSGNSFAECISSCLSHPLGALSGRILIMLVLFGGWQLASGRIVPEFWISDPGTIMCTVAGWIADGSLWIHLAISLLTLFLGYSIGATTGILIGFSLGVLPQLEKIVAPLVAAIYGLPKVALLPLFVIFLGIGIESKVALVAIVVFFLLLYSTMDGVRDVDPDIVSSLRIMGASRLEILLKAFIPSSLPWVYTGLRVSVGYALTTTVVGEMLCSNRGLGFLIESSAARFDSAGVFAGVVVLVGLSLIITATLTRIETSSTQWRL